MPRVLRNLATLCLVLVFALVALSSFIRLSHAGVGCEPWPSCYGLIGADAQAALYGAANPAMDWLQWLHRILAAALGLAVIALSWFAWLHRETWPGGMRMLLGSLGLLVLTVFLAWLGIRSGQLHDLGVVMGNLAGGYVMLGLAGWLVFAGTARPAGRSGLGRATVVAIVLLAGQIWLGGLTSANFAATACTGFPDCQGQWLPDRHLVEAMDLTRTIAINEAGYAVGGPERVAIQLTHRWGAVVVLVWLVGLAIAAWRAAPRLRGVAAALGLLALVQFGIGAGSVWTALPVALAASHNWIAAILLLLLLRLLRAPVPLEGTAAARPASNAAGSPRR